MTTSHDLSRTLQPAGASTLRYGLALNLVWIGRLKFEDYEVANIHPLVTSSPLFAPLLKKVGEENLAKMVGVTEIVLGALVAREAAVPPALGHRWTRRRRDVRHHPELSVHHPRRLGGRSEPRRSSPWWGSS